MKRVVILVSLLLVPCVISAQNVTEESEMYSREAVTLAKICVNEASFFDPNVYNDCAAIHQVIRYRAENVYNRQNRLNRDVSFIEAARIYSPRAFGIERRSDRHWVPRLRRDLSKPRGWPSNLDWEGVYRAQWQAILDHTQQVVTGQIPNPCQYTPQHWGSIQDLRRESWANRLDSGSWRVTECGRTFNYFLHPRRSEFETVSAL